MALGKVKNYRMGERKRSWNQLWTLVAGTLVVVALGAAVFVRQTYQNNLKPLSASQRSVPVTIPIGSSVNEIAEKLEEQGVIRAAWAFEWYVRNSNTRDQLQAGTYNLRPNQSLQEIVTVLTQGKVATDLVTILPGQRLDQVRNALVHNAGFSEADVDAALKPEQYNELPALADLPRGANLEGYLYPDSYQKIAATTPEEIVRASLDEMQKYLTPDVRAGFARQRLTVHEGVTLASIVEQEINNPDDKPKVAQVFLSRLREGMKLQSDVTVIYGAIRAGQSPSLTFESDYNTFKNSGLPPGPISNVSKSSLEAVANPADTDYLYFVAGDDGITYFSKTIEEHEAFVEKHCKKLCNTQ